MSKIASMGWLPDHPDINDYTVSHEKISPLLKKLGIHHEVETTLPTSADLRKWCSPVENQGTLESCTANAAVGMIEYYEKKAFNKYIDASRLFLYKATKNLLRMTGNVPVYLRTTMEAMRLFGVPPEEYWPYDSDKVDDEPGAFCYSYGRNYKALIYFSLNPPDVTNDKLLQRIKTNLACQLPAMFGFTVYSSIEHASCDGAIPYPAAGEKRLGGHAIMAVGYDDEMRIENPGSKRVTKGALLIRNSWGKKWGNGGYGWLPYEYVLTGLTDSWWTLIKNEWVDTGEFKL